MSTTKICRLCLGKVEFEYEELTDDKKGCFASLLLNINISICNNPIMCKRCSNSLKNAYEFKTACLQMEERITAFRVLSNVDVLDLQYFYSHENEEQNLDRNEERVCRFCLKSVKKSCSMSLHILMDNMTVIKDMLPVCMPELDLNITRNPAVCTACIKSLERYFRFARSCWEIEHKLSQYRSSLDQLNEDEIDLNDVLKFISGKLLGAVKDGSFSSINSGVGHSDYDDIDIEDLLKFDEREVNLDAADDFNAAKKDFVLSTDSQASPSVPAIELVASHETKTDGNRQRNINENPITGRLKDAFQCALCPFTAKQKNHLSTHITHSHVRKKRCDLCGFETRTKRSLENHMKVHRRAVFKCVLCPYVAKTAGLLKRHMSRHGKVTKKQNVIAAGPGDYKRRWEAKAC